MVLAVWPNRQLSDAKMQIGVTPCSSQAERPVNVQRGEASHECAVGIGCTANSFAGPRHQVGLKICQPRERFAALRTVPQNFGVVLVVGHAPNWRINTSRNQ